MGFLKDIENMPKQFGYSRQFFDRYYRPDNVVLLVVGDADPDECSRWSRSTTATGRRAASARPSPSSRRRSKEKRRRR